MDRAGVLSWLALGLDLAATTTEGFTPLHIAAGLGNTNVLRALMSAGARLDATCARSTALEIARNGNHGEAFAILESATGA